jgi:hypothetical protein
MIAERKATIVCTIVLLAIVLMTLAAASKAGTQVTRKGSVRVNIITSSATATPTPVPGIYGDEEYGQTDLVASFGADPTGQSDSTAAIQEFVTAIQDGYGGIVPAGTYSVRSTINIVGRNSIRISGLGGGVMGATIFRWDGPSGGTVFALNGVTDSYFQHFAVNSGAGSVGVCFDLTDAGSNRLIDVGCEGSSTAAMRFTNSINTVVGFDRIEQFDIDCMAGAGIQILSSSSIGHDFVDGTIANCVTGIDATSGAFISENLSFSNNQTDVHLGPQNGSTGLYTPESVNAGQFLLVDPTDIWPVKVEGGQFSHGPGQSGTVIDDLGSGPLVLSSNWFVSTSSLSDLQIIVGPSVGDSSAVSIGNVYPGVFPVVGLASISSLGDVSTSLGQLPAKLGTTISQPSPISPTAITPSTPTITATPTPTASVTATVTRTPIPTPSATPPISRALTINPPSRTFSKTFVNATSRSQTVRATNTGSVEISLEIAHVSGDFSRSASTCKSVLPAHKHCTYRLRFSPTAAGPRIGQFSVSYNGASSSNIVLLYGSGRSRRTDNVMRTIGARTR